MKYLIPAACCAALAITVSASADEFTLRIGSGHPPLVAPVGLADTFFIPEVIRRVKEETGHDISFTTAWNGTVAKADGVSDAVQSGILDIGITAVTFEQSRLGLLNYGYWFPFTTPDHVLNTKVSMDLLKEDPALQDSVSQYGITILGLHVAENYGVILRDKYEGLDSLKSKAIACGASSTFWGDAVDATCVLLPVSEQYQALQTGLLDGVFGLRSWVKLFRFHEIVSTYVVADLGPTVAMAVLMNDNTRERLPSEVVAIIDEVAAEHSMQNAEEAARRDEQSGREIEELGINVVTLTDEEKRQWAEGLKDAPARGAAELDGQGYQATDFFRAYVQRLRDAGYEFPVEFPL